jgi:hypothetical protein
MFGAVNSAATGQLGKKFLLAEDVDDRDDEGAWACP